MPIFIVCGLIWLGTKLKPTVLVADTQSSLPLNLIFEKWLFRFELVIFFQLTNRKVGILFLSFFQDKSVDKVS